MIIEIVNPQGKVSYTRPLYGKDGRLHKDVCEALNTCGYSVRQHIIELKPIVRAEKSKAGLKSEAKQKSNEL